MENADVRGRRSSSSGRGAWASSAGVSSSGGAQVSSAGSSSSRDPTSSPPHPGLQLPRLLRALHALSLCPTLPPLPDLQAERLLVLTQAALPHCTPRQTVQLLLDLGRMHVRPQQQWLDVATDCLAICLHDLDPADVFALLQSLAQQTLLPRRPFLQHLAAAWQQHLHAMPLQALTLSLHAFHALGHHLGPQAARAFAAAVLARRQPAARQQVCDHAGLPQEPAGVEGGPDPDPGLQCVSDPDLDFDPADVADLVHIASKSRLDLGHAVWAAVWSAFAPTLAPPSSPPPELQPPQPATPTLTAPSTPLPELQPPVGSLSMAALGKLLHAALRAGQPPPPQWTTALLDHLASRLDDCNGCTPTELSHLLSALRRLDPPPLPRRLASSLRRSATLLLPFMQAGEVPHALQALPGLRLLPRLLAEGDEAAAGPPTLAATEEEAGSGTGSGSDPGSECEALAEAAVMSLLRCMPSMWPAGLVNSLHTMSVLGLGGTRLDRLWTAALEDSGRCTPPVTPEDSTCTSPPTALEDSTSTSPHAALEASGRASPPPPLRPTVPPWRRACLQQLRQQLPQLSASDLASLVASLARLGPAWLPDPPWLAAFLLHSQRRLHLASPGQLCATLGALAELGCRPPAAWMDYVFGAACSRLSCYGPVQLEQLAHACVVLGHRPGPQWLDRLATKAQLQFRSSEFRSLVGVAWALERLGYRPPDDWLQALCYHAARRLHYAQPQSLALLLHTLAAWGYRPGDGLLVDMTLRLAQGGAAGGAAAAAAAAAAWPGCSTQDLSMLLHALATWGAGPPDELLQSHAEAFVSAAPPLPPCAVSGPGSRLDVGGSRSWPAQAAARTAQHVALLLRAHARLRYRAPPELMQRLLQLFEAAMPSAQPRATAMLLVALAHLAYRPSRAWLGALLLSTHRRMLSALARPPHSLTSRPLGFADEQVLQRSPEVWGAAGEAVQRARAERAECATSLALVLWSLARMGVQPGPRWMAAYEEAVLGGAGWGEGGEGGRGEPFLLSLQARALSLWALASLQGGSSVPSRALLQQLLPAPGQLERCNGQDLAQVLWALGTWRVRPGVPWLRCLLRAALPLLPSLQPQGLVMVAWGLARLRVRPPAPFVRLLMAAVLASLPSLGQQPLACILWALARWGSHCVFRQDPGSELDPGTGSQPDSVSASRPDPVSGSGSDPVSGSRPDPVPGSMLDSMSRSWPDPALWRQAVSARVLSLLPEWPAFSLPALLWSLGCLGCCLDRAWLQKYEGVLLPLLPQMRPNELVTVAWALAQQGVRLHPDLLARLRPLVRARGSSREGAGSGPKPEKEGQGGVLHGSVKGTLGALVDWLGLEGGYEKALSHGGGE